MPVNRCRAAPRPSLAYSESLSQGSTAAAGATVSPSLDSTGKVCFITNLSFQGPSLAEPTWASGKIQVNHVWTSDVRVMAGAGGRAGSA